MEHTTVVVGSLAGLLWLFCYTAYTGEEELLTHHHRLYWFTSPVGPLYRLPVPVVRVDVAAHTWRCGLPEKMTVPGRGFRFHTATWFAPSGLHDALWFHPAGWTITRSAVIYYMRLRHPPRILLYTARILQAPHTPVLHTAGAAPALFPMPFLPRTYRLPVVYVALPLGLSPVPLST